MKQLLMLLAMLLVFPVAFANDDGNRCRNINAKAVLVDFEEDREFLGIDYSACYTSKIKGTINGSWISYVKYEWYVILEDLDVQTPDLAIESWYNREFEVFHSKQGTVWGNAQFILDWQSYTNDGGSSIPTMVTGGTGIYEGATGWINAIYLDAMLENFELHGRVCGPNIPND
jgi:hypothetical protein